MRTSAAALTFPVIITATQPDGCDAQAPVRPSRESRSWKSAALPPSGLRFRPSTLPFRPLPPAPEHRPSADIPTKTLLKRGTLK
jgi:hypothetical protein